MSNKLLFFVLFLLPVSINAQPISRNAFETPINVTDDVVTVNFSEFARIPFDGDRPPRLMHMITEAGTERLFVSNMSGVLYRVGFDGGMAAPYLDLRSAFESVRVNSSGGEVGFQSFAFHPQFNQQGAPGYGKFYTYVDVNAGTGEADFVTDGDDRPHDTVLYEWTASDPTAARYDGGAPREIFRAAQPFGNHNGGEVAFNPLAKPGAEDFGLLYVGLADGGSSGDTLKNGQNLGTHFGKILRIDPLGDNSANGQYGIPKNNPFFDDDDEQTLGEIYAYGVRNPQHFGWDKKDGRLLVADIGQFTIEEISPVTAGANLGWSDWEGSYRFSDLQINLNGSRGDAGLTWPLVEYDHDDPSLVGGIAITGVFVVRGNQLPQLQDMMVFGDMSNGEIFYVPADPNAQGGNQAIRRVLLNDNGSAKSLMQLINESNAERGIEETQRAEMRFGYGPNDQLLLLNKRDGIIRLLKP